MIRMTPIQMAVRWLMGSCKNSTPASAPQITPRIWERHASTDALKVGWTTDMAPSMAKISFEALDPYWSTITMETMIAAAVLMVRSPTWNLRLLFQIRSRIRSSSFRLQSTPTRSAQNLLFTSYHGLQRPSNTKAVPPSFLWRAFPQSTANTGLSQRSSPKTAANP